MGSLSNTLIAELGLDTLPAEKQQQLLDRIGTIIYQGVLMRAYDVLSDAQKDALEAKLAAATPPGNPEVIFAFLADNLPNFEMLVEEEVAHFRAESLELFNSLA